MVSAWNDEMDRVLEVITGGGISTAVDGLSTMLGRPITMEPPKVTRVPIQDVPALMGGPEQLVVAVYLMAVGGLAGHIMLILPYEGALRLVDMLLEQPEGTTKELSALEESALGEVGNVSASMLLNFLAATLGVEARPSPPAVIVDMVGAIMDVILSSVCQTADELLMLETVFRGPDRAIEVHFWIVPDATVESEYAGGDGHDGEAIH